MKKISRSEEQTAALAREIAPELAAGDIVTLRGDLGAGKSVFARALIRALTGNPEEEVPSPTFTLVQTYEGKDFPVWHFDLYRLEDAEEIYELGWEEALGGALVIMEWPERMESLLPGGALDICLRPAENEPDSRLIEIRDLRTS